MAKRKKNAALGRPRHRKNPFLGESWGEHTKLVLGAAGGFLGDVYIPAWLLGLLGQSDSGVVSYALAALAVIVPAWALNKFNFTKVAQGWLAGAGAGFVWRVVDDLTGKKLVEVQVQTPQGLSSFFIPQDSVLPGPNVFGKYAPRRGALPAAPPASPTTATGKAAATSTMALSKPASGLGWARYPYAA